MFDEEGVIVIDDDSEDDMEILGSGQSHAFKFLSSHALPCYSVLVASPIRFSQAVKQQ